MAGQFRICPNCKTRNDIAVAVCTGCGRALAAYPSTLEQPTYDFHAGATDLREADLSRFANRALMSAVIILTMLMAAGIVLILSPSIVGRLPGFSADVISEPDTPTPRPTLGMPTVTAGPATPTPSATPLPSATPTPTATPEPCIRQVTSNDTLYGLAASCGHTNFDVLQLIVELNDLPDANSITAGQQIVIPWPTETATPTSEPPASGSADGGTTQVAQTVSDGEAVSAFDEEFDPLFVPTATLRPGVQFHTVSSGENLIIIAQQYNATAEILSQLNPEITFDGCDFGARYGGPRCNVLFNEGQRVRVPAPTPTPTLSPTPSGSETPTPTATATFNAPRPQSPRDRALFLRNELVTLRWVPTGTLGDDEVYRVQVEDSTDGEVFIADTRDTSYILPQEWQGEDAQRHEYRWFISVIRNDDPANPSHVTEPLTFTWEGRGENN